MCVCVCVCPHWLERTQSSDLLVKRLVMQRIWPALLARHTVTATP